MRTRTLLYFVIRGNSSWREVRAVVKENIAAWCARHLPRTLRYWVIIHATNAVWCERGNITPDEVTVSDMLAKLR